MQKIGFIGFGEAAFYMASGLIKSGLKEVHVFDPAIIDSKANTNKITKERALKAGVITLDNPKALAKICDIVILAVPAIFSQAAAQNIIVELAKGQILVDVCSSSPLLKEKLARLCFEKNILYADSPMMGPLPIHGHKVPIIASGTGAKTWQKAMIPWGMNIKIIEAKAGKATKIKLARSIFTKGFEALLVETFQFARSNDIEDVIMQSIGDTIDNESFIELAKRYMGGDLIHAARRAKELEDAVSIMKENNITPHVAKGALERLKASAKLGAKSELKKLKGKAPKDLAQIYQIWEQAGAINKCKKT